MNQAMIKKYGVIALTAAITVAVINRVAAKNATVQKLMNG